MEIKNQRSKMSNASDKIGKNILKKQEAIKSSLTRHKARKEDFLKTKEQIIKDIESAKNIWKETKKLTNKTEFE